MSALIARLVADAREYGRAEVSYLQAVARDRMGDATSGLVWVAAAAALGLAVLVTLLVGLVLSLEPLVGPLLATLIVVIAGAIIAGLLAKTGIAKLRVALRREEDLL